MAMSEEMRKLISGGSAKDPTIQPTGIIPIRAVAISARDHLIYEIAEMIDHALTGPAIGVVDLAEKILDAIGYEPPEDSETLS